MSPCLVVRLVFPNNGFVVAIPAAIAEGCDYNLY